MDHLAPWAVVAAGAFVTQTESNSRVLFLPHRQKHNLGKTESLQRGRRHILTATSQSRLSEGFIWLEPFLRGLCASGNTWEMKLRYLLHWHYIYLLWKGKRTKPWTWFARRLDWMLVQQKYVCNSPKNHIIRQHLLHTNFKIWIEQDVKLAYDQLLLFWGSINFPPVM